MPATRGGSDGAAADALADGLAAPTECVPNKRFCWQGQTWEVWSCNAAGTPTKVHQACEADETCEVVSGVATCKAGGGGSAPDSCEKNKNFCFEDAIWACNVKGEPAGKLQACTGGTTCTTQSGFPQCAAPGGDAGSTDAGGPTSCPANKNFCYGDEIWKCDVKGAPLAKVQTCTSGTTCVVKSGFPQCAAPVVDAGPTDTGASDTGTGGQTDSGATDTVNSSCTPNKNYCFEGDVWGCNAAGTPTGKKKLCGSGTTCGVQAGVATCIQDPVDAGPTDTGAADAGPTDTGPTDTGPADTGAADTGAADTTAPKTCVKGKTFCDGTTIRYCKSDGTWGSVKTQCKSGFVCGIEGGAAVCIEGKMDCSSSPCTCVPAVPDSCVAKTDSSVSFGKVYSTKKKTDCYKPAELEECPKGNSCVAGVCTSSVIDPKAPYYNDSCDLEKHLAAKTNLAADCRCFYNQGIKDGVPVCYRPFDAFKAGKMVSTGPSVGGLPTVAIAGGTYDAKADELIWAVSWDSSTARKGLLLGVDVKTGKRRVISGAYQGSGASTMTGTGANLAWPTEVRFAPNGKLYVLNNTATAKPEVIVVDPATGNRSLLWRGGDKAFGQCASPTAGKSVQYTSGGFAVDTDGSMLIGFANPVSDGRGIARISADAKACSVVTAIGSAGGKIDKGTGGQLGGFVQGFATQGGKIQALTTQPKTLWEINPKTGNRTALVGGGTGTSLGERHVAWDAKRKLFWIAGIKDSVTVYAFDPVSKKLTHAQKTCGGSSFIKVCWDRPININTLNYGGMVVHPSNGRLYFGQDTMAIVEVEPESGNSVLLSL